MRKLVLISVAFIMSSCATAPRMNRLSLGMTKADVIDVLGNPVSTSAVEGTEYLNYILSELRREYPYPYFVRLRNGVVDAYGRHGDFGSTKSNTIDVHIKD